MLDPRQVTSENRDKIIGAFLNLKGREIKKVSEELYEMIG